MKKKKKQNRFLFFLRDKRKKNLFKILWETSFLWISKKEIPFYYFKFLYRKSVTNYKDYLSTKEGSLIQHNSKLHKDELLSIISNKLSFSLYCHKNKLSFTELISHNLGSNYFYKGEVFKVKNEFDLFNFFKYVFDQSNLQHLFIKPLDLYGGAGCFKLSKGHLKTDISNCYDTIIGKGYIHEKVIEQHPDIEKIHSKSVNSIRLFTYIDNSKKTNILVAYMRFGIGDSIVDNVSSGGFQVGINLDTGTLNEVGYQDMEFGGNDYLTHPDSAFIFKDFKVPYFKEVIELTHKASTFLPNRIVGWDIAITPNGPILIEANEYPSVFAPDIIYGGLQKHPKIKEMLTELKKK